MLHTPRMSRHHDLASEPEPKHLKTEEESIGEEETKSSSSSESSGKEDTKTDDSSSGSVSDSDSPIPKPDPNIKPIASDVETPNPLKSPAAAKPADNPISKASLAKTGVKRRVDIEEEEEVKETRKNKKKMEEGDEIVMEMKSKPFQRVWSEEDEIIILKGIIYYVAKKNIDPFANGVEFFEFIKKSLHMEVTKTQLLDKMRKLKKKYMDNASKGRMFSKAHDQNCYELSKTAWGEVTGLDTNGDVARRSTRSKTVCNTVADDEKRDGDIRDLKMKKKKNAHAVVGGGPLFPDLSFGDQSVRVYNYAMKIVNDKQRKEIERKWRRIQEKEIELFSEKADFISEQAKLVLEAMRGQSKD